VPALRGGWVGTCEETRKNTSQNIKLSTGLPQITQIFELAGKDLIITTKNTLKDLLAGKDVHIMIMC
jgi:hypothetical protein